MPPEPTPGGATDPNNGQQPGEGGTPPNPPPTPPDNGGNDTPPASEHMIPKSRFDEVNSKAKANAKALTEAQKELEELRRAQMSDQERQNADLEKWKGEAGQLPALQEQLDASRKQQETFATLWLDGLSDAKRKKVEKFAKAQGAEDPIGIVQHGMALQKAGLLDGDDKPPKPQPPPTHSGQPGSGAPPDPPPGRWGAARAATREEMEKLTSS